MEYTPEIINQLEPNEVFVYGTNQFANHAGGAAKVAAERFGAQNGNGAIGLVGQSYGIITTSFNDLQIDIGFIESQVTTLYYFAESRPDLKFLVTKIGTGIAGFSIEQIRNVFHSLKPTKPFNIILPKEFS